MDLIEAENQEPGRTAFEWTPIWLAAWVGTSLAGGCFGVCAGLLALVAEGRPEFLLISLLGSIFGTIWAGVVATAVVPSFAIVMWSIFCLRYPIVLSAIAGALTGGLSVGFSIVSLITMPFGGLGAGLAVFRYLRSPSGRWFLDYEKKHKLESTILRFNLMDMFRRTTAVAVLISVWSLIAKIFLFARF